MTAALQDLIACNPEVEAERRRAFRALLRKPLLPASGESAEEYILVRRHSDWLKQWLTKFPAWTLHIDKEVVRLRKTPADFVDETRPAVDGTSGTAFSRRRYAVLCLALAALERSDRQATLGEIAQSIMEFADDLPFDIGNYDHRRDVLHAVRLLTDTGVLHKLEGGEQEFLNRNESSHVVYTINRPILAAILNISRSPSAVGSRQAVIDDPTPNTEDARSQSIRACLVRALLDDPILYFNDLNDEERIYLEQHRGYLLRQINEATGLIAEIRREGIAMVDIEGDLTDVQLPDDSAEGHVSLRVVQWLAECSRDCYGAAIPVSAVEEFVRNLIGESGAEERLTEETLSRLRGLRLIRMTAEALVPLAACGRYAINKE